MARGTGRGGIEPRPAALQAALIKVTEALAGELACPTAVRPDWSEFEWLIAQAAAALHGVSPLLSRVLRWRGPSKWVEFLTRQHIHVSDRHARIEKLSMRIDELAREQGLAVLLLKGAALHDAGLYRPGERPMADLDLLVHPRDAARASHLIESLRYREYRRSWKERGFAPLESHAAGELGEHSDNDITIELHERICEKLPLQITDITDMVFPAQPHPGLNRYPSPAALMAHLLMHAAGSMAVRSLRLLQLHDLALLADRMTAADWGELVERGSGRRSLWWALPPLQLMMRYYDRTALLRVPGPGLDEVPDQVSDRVPDRVPARALDLLASQCPWHLRLATRRRTLSEVSYSHLWVDAFPGIEWSPTVSDMLSYARSRVRPDEEHLALRNTITSTQPWAAGTSWSALSQRRRILRWIARRQARPATMHVVRAALAQ